MGSNTGSAGRHPPDLNLNAPASSPPALLPAGTAGQVVMRIPLRLAITDQVDEDEEDNTQPGNPASQQAQQAQQERELPWSVRLAGRLLAKAAQGDACPWAPYLAVSEHSQLLGCCAIRLSALQLCGRVWLLLPALSPCIGASSRWRMPHSTVLLQQAPASVFRASATGAAPDRAVSPDCFQLGGCAGDRGERRAAVASLLATPTGNQLHGEGTCGYQHACVRIHGFIWPFSWLATLQQAIQLHVQPDMLCPLCPLCSTSPCCASWSTPPGWPPRLASSPATAPSAESSGTGRCR